MAKKKNPKDAAKVKKALAAFRKRFAAMPVIDNRSADEILGYGKNGLPGEIWEEGYEP